MKNEIISRFLFDNEIKQWQAADYLGIKPESLCRKLRYDLPEEEQEKIVSTIKDAMAAAKK